MRALSLAATSVTQYLTVSAIVQQQDSLLAVSSICDQLKSSAAYIPTITQSRTCASVRLLAT